MPITDGTLLYHTLTGALYLLSPGETVEENRAELIRSWFLVPQDFDEQKQADEVREIRRLMQTPKGRTTGFTILPTTDCNARCFYCYELGCRHLSMTAQRAKDVADYIIRVSGGDAVKISWFGGEPLLGVEAIDTICETLTRAGVRIAMSRITTNGYYLTPETAKHAAQAWNLKKAQITIDGTKEVYQRTKAYVERDPNAFERILENIDGALAAGIQVSVRMNMDSKNADDLEALSEILAERFRGRPGFSAYAYLLRTFVGKVGLFDTAEIAGQRYVALNDKLRSLGLANDREIKHGVKINHCMADNDESETILPDGTIQKCEHFDDSRVIGSIYTPERNRELLAAWKERVIYPQCAQCPLYPRCYEIRLCPWNTGECPPGIKEEKLRILKKQIVALYEKRKREQT